MPLLVSNKTVDDEIISVKDFMEKYSKFKETSWQLCSQQTRVVGPEGLLYVGQREIGGTSPEDGVISVLGTEDATTCHIAILRHSGSGATCIAHFDGCNSKQGFQSLLELVEELSRDHPPGRLELHLVGGFDDDRKLSHDLSVELLNILRSLKESIHLETACITHLNTELRNGLPFPVFYGLGVDVKTGEIFKAAFKDKGPDLALRGARHFTGGKEMINIYDPKTHQLKFEPFDYEQLNNIDRWCQMPDSFIRKHLSTSPAQEPPHFEQSVRASLVQIRDHPRPLNTMFPGGKPRTYKKLESGAWEKL